MKKNTGDFLLGTERSKCESNGTRTRDLLRDMQAF
jgi:hypothetical protein